MADDTAVPQTEASPGAPDAAADGAGLFARTLAWARHRAWIATTEDDEGGHAGQALLEVPEEHPARGMWPTAIDLPIVLFVPDDGQRVAVYSLIVDGIEPAVIPAAAEFANRANRGLLGGAFEVDLDQGDLRFRSDLDLGAAALDDTQLAEVLGPLLEVNLETVEVYADALVSVLTGAASPAQAVEAAESGD